MTVKPRRGLLCCAIMYGLMVTAECGGCSGKGGDSTGGSESTNGGQPEGPIVRDVDLGLLGDYGPLLDSMVEIAPPKSWGVDPRSSEYLVRYRGSAATNNPFPLIRITTEKSTFAAPNLNEENLAEFLTHVEASLSDAGKTPVESPVTMIIGGRPCVRYVLAGRVRVGTRDLSIEIQRLVTVMKGKRFDVDLQVLKGQIPASRDKAYAVFAGMKFVQDAEGSTPGPEKQPDESENIDKAKQE